MELKSSIHLKELKQTNQLINHKQLTNDVEVTHCFQRKDLNLMNYTWKNYFIY